MANALIGNLAVNLSLETAAFSRGATIAEKRLAAFGDKLKGIGARMQGIGAKLTIGLTAPLAAFGASAFKAASDAAELDSAFNQTFGRTAIAMDKWAENTGNALGRATSTMKEAANTFGIFFNTAVPPEKAAAMSRTFAVLAQDLSSFFNVDTDVAIEKLRAGLAGETEPLRAFGVFLNDAAVKSKALELGLTGVGDELTDQEKIVARYALIMEQTKKAQGDVTRTASGTANQVRNMKEAWKELQVTIGTKLLPLLTPLIEKLSKAIQWFTSLPEPVQNTVLAVAAFSAAAGPAITVLGTLIKVGGPLLSLVLKLGPAWTAVSTALAAARVAALAALPTLIPFLVPLAALAAAVGAVYIAWKNWDQIVAIVQRVYQGVKTWLVDKFGAVVDSVKQKVDSVTGFFRDMWDRVVGHSYVPDMVDGIAEHFARLQGVMVEPTQRAVEDVMRGFADIGRSAIDDIARAAPMVIRGFASIADAAADMANRVIDALIEMTTRFLIFQAISGIGKALRGVSAAGDGIGITDSLGGLYEPAFPGFARGGSGVFGGFGGIDRNILSLNGSPIARVSKGERFTVDNDRGPREPVTIHQTFQFEGVAVTRDEFMKGLMFAKTATIAAIKDERRRR